MCAQGSEVTRPPFPLPLVPDAPHWMPTVYEAQASSFNPFRFLCGSGICPVYLGDWPCWGGLQEWGGVGWGPGSGLRALGCRLPVSLSQGLPLPGLSPLPSSWAGSFPESLARSSFLWVDKGEEGRGRFCAQPGVSWSLILGIPMT